MSKLYKAIILLLLIITLGTFYDVITTVNREKDIAWDFFAYYEVTDNIVQGNNPYNTDNFTVPGLIWKAPPIVNPGYTLFFLPYTLLKPHTAKLVFLLINIFLGVGIILLVFARMRLLKPKDLFNPDKNTLLAVVSIFIFLNSTPFIYTLITGQSLLLILACLILVLFSGDLWMRIAAFSISAVFKYSLLPLLGIWLLIKKRFALCVGGFLLFILWGLVPLFFGYDLGALYGNYLANLIANMSAEGLNTFRISGFDMLQFDFLNCSFTNAAVKLILIGIAFWAMLGERKKTGISINLLFLLGCVTMIISYHRLYDLIIILPILLILWNNSFRKGQWLQFSITGLFLLFFLIERTYIIVFANWLGGLIGPNPVLVLNTHKQFSTIFPVYPIVMFLMAAYSVYLFLKEDAI
ncbi:glycosyltransferase 87 family protein [Candidatus Margulisiibacteriota bacterium]